MRIFTNMCTTVRLTAFIICASLGVAKAQSDSTLHKPTATELISRIEGSSADGEKAEKTYSITVTVTNIRNNKGTIRFKFYDDSTPFPDDHGFLKVVVDKSEVVNGTLTKTFTGFTSKRMAIALLDDENNDVKLDMGWFFPKEGHAFSDYYHSALRRPVYSDFNFVLTGDKVVVMKMKYY